MKQFFSKLISSLDTHSKGYSARKLTALAVILMIIVGHIFFYRYCTRSDKWDLWVEVLIIDYGMIAVCLGLTTWENLKGKKDEKQPEKQPENVGATNS